MRVLVACEFSGTVREAFNSIGANAWSCDLEPSELLGNHYQCDVLDILHLGWDLLIAHPPCTYLCVSGARWMYEGDDLSLFASDPSSETEVSRTEKQEQAIHFVRSLLECNIERIALENPVGVLSTRIRKPNQIIHPWQFGHPETKSTCLWLKNLPCLVPTSIVTPTENRIHRMGPSKSRSKERSRTYAGIARAMAQQWGLGIIPPPAPDMFD